MGGRVCEARCNFVVCFARTPCYPIIASCGRGLQNSSTEGQVLLGSNVGTWLAKIKSTGLLGVCRWLTWSTPFRRLFLGAEMPPDQAYMSVSLSGSELKTLQHSLITSTMGAGASCELLHMLKTSTPEEIRQTVQEMTPEQQERLLKAVDAVEAHKAFAENGMLAELRTMLVPRTQGGGYGGA
ncbi:unnamed protein product [Effrenium voratum]|nr:unnamed protein product [Effrenium voratum]CAJ1453360.1 unnamed protein product [Effrenium voratum]